MADINSNINKHWTSRDDVADTCLLPLVRLGLRGADVWQQVIGDKSGTVFLTPST